MKIQSKRLLSVVALTFSALTVQAQTRANVAHLAPFADNELGTAVSVDVNSTEVLNPVVYNQVSGYLPLSGAGVAPGPTSLEVFAPPGTPPAAISAMPNLLADTDYTVAAIGDGTNQPLQLLPLIDDNSAPAAGNIKIRIVHAAPFDAVLANTEVSIRDDMGTVIGGLTNVPFGAGSPYLEVPAGIYDLQVATPDGTTTLIDIAPVDLADGTVVTVFAVGGANSQPLGITAIFGDGTSAPLALEGPGIQETRALVAHFAPFADSLPATAVSVDVNGTEVLNGVTFNQASGYLPLSAAGVAPGITDLEVFAPPATPPAAISASPELAANTDYTVAAIGDGANQPLQLLPLVDDNNAPGAGNIKLRVVHAAPFAAMLSDTAVSIRTDAGFVVGGLSNVEFGMESGYLEVPAGMYDLQVATPDGLTTLINLAPLDLADGTIVTVFAVGDGVNQPLGITAIFSDGTNASLGLEPIMETVFEEDFSGGQIPANWTNEDTGAATALWTFCADPTDDRTTPGCPQIWPDDFNLQGPFAALTATNGFVTLDSDFYGNINHVSELTLPSLDLSLAETVELNFQSHIGVFTLDADPNAKLRISTDGGATWDEITVFPGLVAGANNPPLVRWSANPTISSYDITKFAAGESNVLIQWQWTGNFEYQWSLDDINVRVTEDGDLIFRNGFE